MANENINFFNTPDSCRTLALEVKDHTFWLPRDTLATYSPVFKAMLYGDFAESNKDVIRLPKKEAIDIEELLYCLIPTPSMKEINDSNVDLMLGFADEYQIEDLRRRAESFLVTKLEKCKEKKDQRLLDILRIASNHEMRILLEPCIKRCAEEFQLDELQAIFDNLKSEVIACLLLYKANKISKCQFYTLMATCTSINESPHMFNKCKNCSYKYCTQCKTNEKSVCSNPPITEKINDSLRALLNRMQRLQ